MSVYFLLCFIYDILCTVFAPSYIYNYYYSTCHLTMYTALIPMIPSTYKRVTREPNDLRNMEGAIIETCMLDKRYWPVIVGVLILYTVPL